MACKAPSRPRIRESRCAELPPEVWINIFSYHTDAAHLWTACRRISSTLRWCAESAFAEYFLPHIHIDFQLEKYNLGGKSKRPEVPVTFSRLGKRHEQDMVWFKDARPRHLVQQFDKMMTRWEENVRNWTPEMPNYTISICGAVNDTALPGLAIDVANREISFNWRDMLHLFYREHSHLHALKSAWHKQTTARIRQNNARLAKGEKLMPGDYPQPWAAAEAEMRKSVRRARLKEHYKDDERMVWAIESLGCFEQSGTGGGVDPDLPGAGLGEKWFGCVNLVQELFLDEWSCEHRIEGKIESERCWKG
ncbi:hypothetical protein HBI91_060030 [Parastagonospora nodorum]|nr:hypothetical protein HBI91_060030 [Parastagonospora nodorum]